MTPQERKATFSLASIYAFRMLGLFMILPVFSLYENRLQHANATLIGLALGIYGLTQAILQIPFGIASDRIGRKPIIIIGLVLFMLGSIIAALSHDIYGIIIGRAVQGAGAIGSTLIALLADTTEEDNRLKAMSMIGMTIGFSFMVAMVLGPIINSLAGLSGIFGLTALFALAGLFLLRLVPTPQKQVFHRDSEPVLSQLTKVLCMPELLRLNFGIFSLHAILMALFIVIPITLVHSTGLAESEHWMIYLPVLIIACIVMFPFVIIAEAKRLMKPVFVGAIVVLVLMELALRLFTHNLISISVVLCIFFAAFTLLESILPSLISKIAPAGSKGTAMGIYSSAQFLGIFVGGAFGGYLFNHFGANSIFSFCAILSIVWALVAVTMKKPLHLSSKIVKVGKLSPIEAKGLQKKLLAMKGVKEVMISIDEEVAYLKIDKREFVEHEN